MANDTSRNGGLLWVLDTAAVITTDKVRIAGLRWIDAGAVAGDAVTVEDANGEIVWESVATGPNYVESEHFGERGRDFNGFELASIAAGGKLYVYHAEHSSGRI